MGRRLRSRGQPIDGVVLLDKPFGWTSNFAVQRVKRLFNARKVGHTGTLDQRATGVLPLCLGEATKFSQYGLSADKSYDVVAQLGVETTTGDADGDIVAKKPVQTLDADQLNQVLDEFRGEIDQVPSMFSAIKRHGQPLYKLARQGIEVERAARKITISRNELVELEGDMFALKVDCSKGTYIRTLVTDIGRTIGCGAHVRSLARSAVGHFGIRDCVQFDDLQEAKQTGQLQQFLLPISVLLESWINIKLPRHTAYLVRQGQPVAAPSCSPALGWVKLLEESANGELTFLGIGEIQGGLVAPRRLVT